MALRFQSSFTAPLGQRAASCLALLLFTHAASACGDPAASMSDTSPVEGMDDGAAGTGPADAGAASDPCIESDDEDPRTEPFAGFVSNRVLWAQLSVTAEAARVVSEGTCEPSRTLEVDLRLQNQGWASMDLSTRATWDLLLSNDVRIASQQPIGVLVERGKTVFATLRYELEGAAVDEVAALQLNAEERGDQEPELLHLRGTHPTDQGLRLPELKGQVIALPTDGLSFEVEEAVISANDTRLGWRAAGGERFVMLDVLITVTDGEGQFVSDRERLVLVPETGEPIETRSMSTLRLQTGHTGSIHFSFPVDEEMERFAIEFLTTDGQGNQRIAVDLANAVAVEE